MLRGWWEHPRLSNSLQPMTFVTWYEAQAYVAWAAALYEDGDIKTMAGEALRLAVPTEALWESAMRGPLEGRGDKRVQKRWPHELSEGEETPGALDFNHADTRWCNLSPVGVFSSGMTTLGVADAAGNTWDWCSNAMGADAAAGYADHRRQEATCIPTKEDDRATFRALRGGSAMDSSGASRVACRFRVHPGGFGRFFGVRLVRTVQPHFGP